MELTNEWFELRNGQGKRRESKPINRNKYGENFLYAVLIR